MGSSNLLPLINDILQAVIVIFGTSVVLYNLPFVRQDRLVRAFSLLLVAVVLVFFTELLVSRTELPGPTEAWLYTKWFGIVFVPAVQFHLSHELLSTTGSLSVRRKAIMLGTYLVSAVVYVVVVVWDGIVGEVNFLPNAAHFEAGIWFPLFAAFYWIVSVVSIYNVWRAYQRGITRSTRRRMRDILLTIMAAPLSVFPYLGSGAGGIGRIPAWLWLLLILGNVLVGFMFSQLTTNITYLGSLTTARVARVKLLKFMARVPMTASIVLLVYVLTLEATAPMGLDPQTAAAITTVATVMLVEWAIHAYKGPIERILHFNNDPDIRRIQQLSDLLLTRQDMQQFMESLLAAGCNALRVPTAFVAAISADGAQLSAFIGDLNQIDANALPAPEALMNPDDNEIRWQNYWIKPLYARDAEVLVGILGVGVSQDEHIHDSAETAIVERLAAQAANSLEDQLLQQGLLAAVEGLLPTISAMQELRTAAVFSGAKLLQEDEPVPSAVNSSPIVADPDFKNMVRDALNHYWGGSKLTDSPLLKLRVVQNAMGMDDDENPVRGLRTILKEAIERQKPDGEQSLTRTEWLLYNILELKFLQGNKVRDIALRLAMSESDLYRKQRVAIENVARAIAEMETNDVLT